MLQLQSKWLCTQECWSVHDEVPPQILELKTQWQQELRRPQNLSLGRKKKRNPVTEVHYQKHPRGTKNTHEQCGWLGLNQKAEDGPHHSSNNRAEMILERASWSKDWTSGTVYYLYQSISKTATGLDC